MKSSEQPGCTAEPCPERDRLHKRFKAAESMWSEVSVAPKCCHRDEPNASHDEARGTAGSQCCRK
jgi:hypothetical protein